MKPGQPDPGMCVDGRPVAEQGTSCSCTDRCEWAAGGPPPYEPFPPDLRGVLGVLADVTRHGLRLASYRVRPYDFRTDRRVWWWQQRCGLLQLDELPDEQVRQITAGLRAMLDADAADAAGRPAADRPVQLEDVPAGSMTAPESCRSESGITVGLVDAVIAVLRVLAARNLTPPTVQEALADLREDPDLADVLGLERR